MNKQRMWEIWTPSYTIKKESKFIFGKLFCFGFGLHTINALMRENNSSSRFLVCKQAFCIFRCYKLSLLLLACQVVNTREDKQACIKFYFNYRSFIMINMNRNFFEEYATALIILSVRVFDIMQLLLIIKCINEKKLFLKSTTEWFKVN